MKRGLPRKDGLDDLLPGLKFVQEAIRKLRLPQKKGLPPNRKFERESHIVELYRGGQTQQEIGDQFNISRERVRQILARLGLSGDSGGATLRAINLGLDRQKKRAANRTNRFLKILGTPPHVVAELIGSNHVNPWTPGTPTCAYLNQKRNAAKRGIGWDFNFAEWWRVWQESGKWDQRGRGEGYCMARIGDDGPYRPENVYICTIGQNFSDSYAAKPAHKRKRAEAKGWCVINGAKAKPYMASFRGQYLGYFETPEAAHAAYLAARVAFFNEREAA